MSQDLKAGSRWASSVDDTEVIVVRTATEGGLLLECGGRPMLPAGAEKVGGDPDAAFSDGTQVGKRYEHASGLELLCTKAGRGSLAVNGEVLPLKVSKPLPSSD